jgi:hypothetical protein
MEVPEQAQEPEYDAEVLQVAVGNAGLGMATSRRPLIGRSAEKPTRSPSIWKP